jgi:hypothetical protein
VPVLEVLSITIKLTVPLYTKYWLNSAVNTLTTPILIIILYYLSELYREVFLKVVKYIKGKVDLSKTTPINTY